MSQITASVVLYNTPETQLIRLLDCIAKSSISIHTYLIDHSPDPLDHSCFHRPGVNYTQRPNVGYGAGHNFVLREIAATSDLHFILNPDISFGPAELRKMADYMEQELTIGQLMPKVTYSDGSLQYLCKLLPTPADLFLRRFSPGLFRNVVRRRIDRFELRSSGYQSVMDVPFLSGCMMLLRTATLQKIGLFDERFFMYAEDVDFSRRMHRHFRTVFYPYATIVHDHARESYKTTRALRDHTISTIKYFNKWGWFWDPERRRYNRDALMRLEGLASAAASIQSPSRCSEIPLEE